MSDSIHKDLNISSNIYNDKINTLSNEAKLEAKISEYLSNTNRTPSNDLKLSLSQLLCAQLTIKEFCKNIMNSNNTNDVDAVESILKELKVSLPDIISKNFNLNKVDDLLKQNNNNNYQDNKEFVSKLNIINTLADNEILATEILQKLTAGKTKEVINLLQNSESTLEPVLDKLLSNSNLSNALTSNLILVLQHLETEKCFNPVLQERVAKELAKLKKKLLAIPETELDTDITELSEEAKNYISAFNNLLKKINEYQGDIPEELTESFKQLLVKLGMAH